MNCKRHKKGNNNLKFYKIIFVVGPTLEGGGGALSCF